MTNTSKTQVFFHSRTRNVQLVYRLFPITWLTSNNIWNIYAIEPYFDRSFSSRSDIKLYLLK